MASRPPAYAWPHGKRCAVLFSADVDGETPYLWRHRGRPMILVETLEQRRFGPRVGVYRILDLLQEFDVQGSFFVPGYVAERYPSILPEIVARNHEVGLHGYHHESVADLSSAENAALLARCMDIVRSQTGTVPRGYRAPYWHMTADMLQVLTTHQLAYDSSLMGYDHPYLLDGLVEIPVQAVVTDTTYFRCTGGPDDKTYPPSPNQVFDLWIEAFEGLRDVGGLYTITIHPWIAGQGYLLRMLRKLLSYIRRYEDVWCATAAEIAAYHRQSSNAAEFSEALAVPAGIP